MGTASFFVPLLVNCTTPHIVLLKTSHPAITLKSKTPGLNLHAFIQWFKEDDLGHNAI